MSPKIQTLMSKKSKIMSPLSKIMSRKFQITSRAEYAYRLCSKICGFLVLVFALISMPVQIHTL